MTYPWWAWPIAAEAPRAKRKPRPRPLPPRRACQPSRFRVLAVARITFLSEDVPTRPAAGWVKEITMKKRPSKLELNRETLRALGATDNDVVWSGLNHTCGDGGCTECPGTGGVHTCAGMFCSAADTCEYCQVSAIGTACC